MSPRTLIFATILLAPLFSGCAGWRTFGITDRAVMREFLLEAVPIGTNVKDAQAFMVREGFSCTIERNSSFSERNDDDPERGPHRTLEGIDYLYCDRTELAHFLIDRRWQIAFVLNGETVSDLIVNVGLIGP